MKRSAPLEADRSHSFYRLGETWKIRCERCDQLVHWPPDKELPDWQNCPGMKRGSGLSRSKGVRPRADREKRAHQKDEGYREFVRRQSCVVCGATPCDPAHVKNWGAGWGDWLPGGDGNVVSLCRRHHDLSENEIGWGAERFAEEFNVDLADEARRLGERYQQEREAA